MSDAIPRKRRKFAFGMLGLIVACALIYAFMSLSACEPDQLVSNYGQRRGEYLQESVNGTVALSRLFEQAGHTVASWRRLSPRIRSYDTLVWIPDLNSAPSRKERDFLDEWLADAPGRTLVYVGRDFDSASLYWRTMRANAPNEQSSEIDSRLSSAIAQHDVALSNGPHWTYARWFVVRPGAHYPVKSLSGPWAQGVDPTAMDISVGTRLVAATNDDIPQVGAPLPTFAPSNARATTVAASAGANGTGKADGNRNANRSGKANAEANSTDKEDSAPDQDSSKTVPTKSPPDNPPDNPPASQPAKSARKPAQKPSQTGSSASTPATPSPPPTGANQGRRARRLTATPITFGSFPVETATVETLPVPNSEVLLETDRGEPLVRRVYDGAPPFETSNATPRRSQILVVTNGSFLLNMGLVNREHRKLAARLVEACGPPGNVGFLESGPTGLQVLDKEPQNTMPSGMGLFTIYPLNILILHLIGVGLLFCFTSWPIFGRAKHLPTVSVADFGAHIEAVGDLLERTGDRKTARQMLENYQKMTKETR